MLQKSLIIFLTSALASAGLSVDHTGDSRYHLHYAEDYKEVYSVLQNVNYSYYWYDEDYIVYDELYTTDAAEDIAAYTEDAVAEEMSVIDTNAREDGVGESDTVKSDGTYLYLLQKDDTIAILDVSGDEPVYCSSIIPEDDSDTLYGVDLKEFYYQEDCLYILSQGYSAYSSGYDTLLLVYDISSRDTPALVSESWQSGTYETSRIKDGYLYLLSEFYPYLYGEDDIETFVPLINEEYIPAESICIPPNPSSSSMQVISTFSLEDPSSATDVKTIISGGSTLYAGKDSIYLLNEYWFDDRATDILKLECTGSSVEINASCTVPGYVNDSYSIDEYNHHLRVLTTYDNKNALYIFDDSLQKISRLSGIAKGETIKSARYFGDTVYFVTFEQHDPLFTADLSDPENPELTGELVVSGFSAYLHGFGEGRLVGLGYEADDNGTITGIKLSLFDNSDPQNITEASRFVLDGITSLQALDNPKSIYVNPDKKLMGFYHSGHYFLFSVEEDTASLKLLYDLYSDGMYQVDNSWWNYSDAPRGLSINDSLYIAGDGFVTTFDINTMEKASFVTFG